MIIWFYSSPFRLLSACHLALVVMVMRRIPSPSQPTLCLTFMGLKSSEWWSANVWDSKLHRFNWEESSPWVCWRSLRAGLEQNSMLYIHIKKGKIWWYFPLYDAEINLSPYSHINLTPCFAKYCFTLLYTIFYIFIAYKHKPSQRANVLINIITKWS